MSNIYDILHKTPALEKWQISPDLELLAESLVKSGRLRIDTEKEINFARFSRPYEYVNMMFSYRELFEPKLTERTIAIIRNVLSYNHSGTTLDNLTQSEFARLRDSFRLQAKVSKKAEYKLARAIVQSNHPAVIHLLIAEGAEVFISYSYSVGDMLDIQTWQEAGDSSGLQSRGYNTNAVFVSCSGNPFITNQKDSHNVYDGFKALARLIVIAGQEIGHFADVIRDKRGRATGRHASNLSATMATRKVSDARNADISHLNWLEEELNKIGLAEINEYERHLKFFKKQKKRFSLVAINTRRKANNLRRTFYDKSNGKYDFLFTINMDKEFPVSRIAKMIADMKFNLEPKAPAYERDDPKEEEAIACVEALARVPQQVNKWGHVATKALTPNLYEVYYNDVVPACIKTYEQITGNEYSFHERKRNWLNKIWLMILERLFR